MSISANYGPPADRSQGIEVIRAAHAKGVTFFDTAEVYGPYTNEELVGEALAPFRDKVVIATKFGFDIEAGGLNSRPEHIRKVVEGSLKRLRTDRIDLYYQHRVDPKVPIEDVAGAVKDLIKRGQGPALRPLRGERARPSAARTPFSRSRPSRPSTRSWNEIPERNGVLETCEELGIGFVPWGPLGMGYLTGKIDARTKLDPKTDLRAGFDRFSPENLAANQPIVDLLTRVRGEEGRDTCPDRAGVAAGAEAVDRSDPRHAQHGPPRGEPGCGRRPADACGSSRDRGRVLEGHRPRRSHGRALHARRRPDEVTGALDTRSRTVEEKAKELLRQIDAHRSSRPVPWPTSTLIETERNRPVNHNPSTLAPTTPGQREARRTFAATIAVLLLPQLALAAPRPATASKAAEVRVKSVTFDNSGIVMAGNLYLPKGFSESGSTRPSSSFTRAGASRSRRPACTRSRLAEEGFVTLAFDASHQGASGGMPRFVDDPMKRVGDIYSAVDYLTSLPYVDAERIGALGVCAGSGTTVKAAMTERRIKAVATVSAVDVGAATRKGWDGKAPKSEQIATLEAVAKQRTAEAAGAAPVYVNYVPRVGDTTAPRDLQEAADYYLTPRGQHPNSTNQMLMTSVSHLVSFTGFERAETC